MKQFYNEIKLQQQDLAYSELIELFNKYQDTKTQAIRDKIFNANVRLVFSISKKYPSNKEDVEQFGFIGLLNAIENFNPTYNIRFSTYATTCITNEINNGIIKVSKLIPIPKHAYKKVMSGEITEVTTIDLEDIELENLAIQQADNGIDKDLFWFLLKEICSEDEIDLLIKRYCNESNFTLNQVAESISQTKQYTNGKIKRIINRLKKNEFFKNKINESM
ncbi:sigma-70 family RNA polymerase sigma factor [Flavobacterium sp. MC2016-06]|uniref:sigma-70 family RNA polymerase sigma factor n=1 Tax=Flavobacterium sp. MC2016-06 TaxID=2676308 RepID=UPI0012BA72C8|nr:sigma-70 family RNA polymerase sigma factor [Flavobacterium sp. MC2016-06]MBU3860981.1 sigma-70 family RNA polymerase sigma factor [Flavobacterium sp. MC2016-06]